MRLIDADALYAYVREEQRRNPHNGHVERIMHNHEHEAFLRDIWYAPTIDAVPVVRCKDCLYSTDSWAKVNEKGFLICPASGMEITDMDFCSYGERKDGDGNV